MIEVCKTIEELEALKENWNDVFSKSSTATPYQAWQFVKTTWQVWHKPGDKLYVICYNQSKGKQYDAFLPCYINKIGELHLLDYMTDFCDGVILDELLECYDMYYDIMQFIENDLNIRSVCFDNMRQESRLMAYLYGLGAFSQVQSVGGYTIARMHYSDKNQDFVDSIVGCNSKHRRKLRKVIKENENLSVRMLCGAEPYPKKAIRELGDFMVTENMRNKNYLSDSFYSYFKELYNHGQLLLLLLYDGDILSACKFLLKNTPQNELVSWVVLYRSNRYNSASRLFSLDYMYRNGIYNLNFARGVYAYKMSNFHPNVYILNRLVIYRSQKAATYGLISVFLGKTIRFLHRKLHL